MTAKIVPRARVLAAGIVVLLLAATLAQPSILGKPIDPAAPLMPLGAPPGSPCPVDAPVRFYAVTSLAVPISYNVWGDFDAQGRLFIPDELRDAMLADVGHKLEVAGIPTLYEPLGDVRAALRAHDLYAAAEASERLAVAAAGLDAASPPRDRFVPSDLVTPLVLRAHVGDCVVVRLSNAAPEPTSLHVHAVVERPGGGAAVGMQDADLALPGTKRTYEFYIPPVAGMEGAHFLHSHADTRWQTRHGLFGAIVAEPRGSLWLSTVDGRTPAPYGLEAMIVREGASDFREFVKIYHDEIELTDMTLNALPSVSPYGEYGPGTKGISLRSEPFMNRFKFHDALRDADRDGVIEEGELARGHDKSQAYGSYTYGDPSTFLQRSYLGDPVKFRMINAGPGQHHIHHLHGGGIRWRSTPMTEPTAFDLGLTKRGDPRQVDVSASQRVDVQNAGPGESFTLEPEGGTGGVQRSAGDFLYHCHIAEHYLAGMWGIWRAYNTLQPGLAELPDRAFRTAVAVNSTALLGHRLPDGKVIGEDVPLAAWVESFLPARGVPGEEDASVWDWSVVETPEGALYLGEPETAHVWPTYPADAPGRLPAGTRPQILFDPLTAKPAYPMLRPHLGARPPFSPDHGGTPWLTGTVTQQAPDGLCPSEAPARRYDVVALQAKVKYSKFDTDSQGQVFALAKDRAGIESGSTNPTSIVLRANAGDCVDVTLTSMIKEKKLGDNLRGVHAKTNIHIHLVQFDVQGSDGVVAGYNFETTVRSLDGSYHGKTPILNRDPSAQVTTRLGASPVYDASADESIVPVVSLTPFLDRTGAPKVGSSVGFGLGETTIESAKLLRVDAQAGTIVVRGALRHAHVAGEFVGYEYVRYRWYPDVELGTVYFHDHVNGLDTWRHGLFGSLIVEPSGSRWLPPKRVSDDVPDDPTSPIVDIIPAEGAGRAYRELVLHFMDRGCVNNAGANDCLDLAVPAMPDRLREPAGFNLRAEPLHRRNLSEPFWSAARLSKNEPSTPGDDRQVAQGDPMTPILEAYPGDDVVIRYLYAGQSASRGAGAFGVTGHRFPVERWLPGSRVVDTVSVAESSHHDLALECGAGGCLRQPGDYLYRMTQSDYLDRGAWGILRVHDPADLSRVRVLPDNAAPAVGVVPEGTTVRYYDVSAVDSAVTHNPTRGVASMMRRFVLDEEIGVPQNPVGRPTTTSVELPPSPLVLRAAAGEVVQVNFTNRLASGRAGLHAGMVSAGPLHQGVNVGLNPMGGVVGPGQTHRYVWYADQELGVVDLVSLADPVRDAALGLTGALVVEPAGAAFSSATGPASKVTLPDGSSFEEHVLLFASPDAQFMSSTMPYAPDVAGLALINFATEPLLPRVTPPAQANGAVSPFSGAAVGTCHADTANCMGRPWDARNPLLPFATAGAAPWTPIVQATKGSPLVLRVVGASGDQLAVFHLDGHAFAADPDMDECRVDHATCRSNLISTFTLGARETRNVWIPSAGMGGAGDYLYRNHRDAYFEAGAWGLLRVS